MLFAGVFSVLLCVCSLSTAQIDLKTCGSENSDITCSFFFQKVDQAFRERDVLYTLRKSFFPSQGARPQLFDIFMTVNINSVPNITCSNDDFLFRDSPINNLPSMSEVCSSYTCLPHSLEWEHQWSKTIITYIIEREDLHLLQDTNFIAYSAATFNNFDTSVFSEEGDNLRKDEMNSSLSSIEGKGTISFLLSIDFLPCHPDDGVLRGAWEDILPWIQLYAKNSDNLENVEYSQEERGYAFLKGKDRQKGLTVPLLAIIHILLNVVFSLAVTYLLFKYHSELNQVKGKQYQLVASMYWSVVFMCFIGAVVIITGNAYLYYALVFIGDQSPDVFGFRIASDFTVGILAVIELISSVLTPHDPNFFIPHLIRRTLCCNQCCRCCSSQSRVNILRRLILGIAMWIIILFLQIAISSVLPIAIVVVSNPVPSLAFVSILIALFFCMVVFVAYFLNAFEGNYISRHRLSKKERRMSSVSLSTLMSDWSMAGDWARNKLVLIAQAFVFLVIFAVVVLVVVIYLNFVRAGANTNTVGGLFFSLVPSVVLGGITWAAKKHLFKEFEEEEEEEGDRGAKNSETKKVKLQIGDVSIHPKMFRKSAKKMHNEKNTKTPTSTPSSPTAVNQDTKTTSDTQDANTNGFEPTDTAILIDQPEESDTVLSNAEALSEAANIQVEGNGTAKNVECQVFIEATIDSEMVKMPFIEGARDNDDPSTY